MSRDCSFELYIQIYKPIYGWIISPLLFVVVSSESRSGLPSELLYASDLVFMAPTMEQPGIRVADWREPS